MHVIVVQVLKSWKYLEKNVSFCFLLSAKAAVRRDMFDNWWWIQVKVVFLISSLKVKRMSKFGFAALARSHLKLVMRSPANRWVWLWGVKDLNSDKTEIVKRKVSHKLNPTHKKLQTVLEVKSVVCVCVPACRWQFKFNSLGLNRQKWNQCTHSILNYP